MAKASRDKGARGEREVAAIFRDAGFAGCERTPNSGGLHIPGDLVGLEGIHVESKRYGSRVRWDEWWPQAVTEAPTGTLPLLAMRADKGEWVGAAPLTELVALLAKALL